MDHGEILIAGLGSIGRRHLRNLKSLGQTRIRLFRTGQSTLPDAELTGVPVDIDLDQALARRPRAVIISNPTSLHIPTAIAAVSAGADVLIEKPVSHAMTRVDDLRAAAAASGAAVLVGFHFRFHPGLEQIRRWIEDGALGTVRSGRASWSEFLPSMHPWEDFRIGYAARSALGGGVLNTLCHPFDYLRWLLGEIDEVTAVETRTDELNLEVDTSVDVDLAFASGATGHVHLDFVQKPRRHHLVIIGTAGSAGWNDHDHTAWLSSDTLGRQVVLPPFGFERNTMFVDELRHFLACVRRDEVPRCTLEDGIATLKVVLAAKDSLAQAPSLVAPA